MPRRARVLIAALAAVFALTACQSLKPEAETPAVPVAPLSAIDAAILNLASTPHTFVVSGRYGDDGELISTYEGGEKPGAIHWRETRVADWFEARVVSPDMWHAYPEDKALGGGWGHWSSVTTATAALQRFSPVNGVRNLNSAVGGLTLDAEGRYRATITWVDVEPGGDPFVQLAMSANVAARKGPILTSVLEAVITDGRLTGLTVTSGEGAVQIVSLDMAFTVVPDVTVAKPEGPITELSRPVQDLPA